MGLFGVNPARWECSGMKKPQVGSQKTINVAKIKKAQRRFVKARDWEQFHTPKNLAIALSVEASELLELLQWKSDQDVRAFLKSKEGKRRFADELSDILYYLIRIADMGGFNLEADFWKKMERNQKKYPVHLSKGNAKKWSELTSSRD
jgi:dCTP diphosphatase